MILKSDLERIADNQFNNLQKRETGIRRDKIEKINHHSKLVKIISGIRRCGKSTLIHQIMNTYENTFYLNFETPGLTGFRITDFEKLDEIIKKRMAKNLFFDEIQNVESWERYIRSKHDEGFNLYITGSNASMLSKELGTKLTGRYLMTELFPFSYNEFLKIKRHSPDSGNTELYMSEGGFPEYLKNTDNEYLHRIFYDVLYRDVAIRHKIKHVERLKELAMFLITNANKKISYNKIKNIFSLGSTNTVIDYISYFQDSYLFFILPKFDYSVKKQIINERKIYSIDTGLSSVNSASYSDDTGRKLENIVYLHLRNKFRDIFYYTKKFECDFVVRKKIDDFSLFQVCLELNHDNIDREINGLREVMDYVNTKTGTIITLNQKDSIRNKETEIQVIPFHEFSQV